MLFSPSALEDLIHLVDKDKGLHLQEISFWKPKILVLDEPNANLDKSGENVLKYRLIN